MQTKAYNPNIKFPEIFAHLSINYSPSPAEIVEEE